MNDTKIAEILKAFEIYDGTYKRTHVDAALELQEEITPHLIDILEKVLADPSLYANNQDYFAHIYAVILLGHFREYRAHRVIVDLFSLPPDLPGRLFGDIITETLPAILFRTCNGSMDMIKSLALNRNADQFCRGSALQALVFAVTDGMIPREEVLAFFGSLFTGNEAAPDSHFWSLLASCVCDLYPEELMSVIEKAYQDELIWPGFIGYESFRNTLKGSKEQALNRVREEIRRYAPDNVHDYMSWWACFKPEKPSISASVPSGAPSRKKPRKKLESSLKARRKRKGKRKASRKKKRR